MECHEELRAEGTDGGDAVFGVVRSAQRDDAEVESLGVADHASESLDGGAGAAEAAAGKARDRARCAVRFGSGGRRAGRVHAPPLLAVERGEDEVQVQVSHGGGGLLAVGEKARGGVPAEEHALELPTLALNLHGEAAEELDVAGDLLEVARGHGLEPLEHRQGHRAELLDRDVPERRVQEGEERALGHHLDALRELR